MSQHGTSHKGSLRERLAQMQDLSKGESEVALWVDRHYDRLPFANVSDLAEGAGVSDMTVSRFARRLGYKNFKAFKAAAAADYRGTGPGESLKRARRIAVAKGTDSELSDQLQLELDAIIEVYALAATDTWRAAHDVIEAAETVNITGFQGVKGMAMDFATRLKYTRPGIRYADGRSGNWSEIFIERPDRTCVVLIDIVPYAHESVKIADLCRERNIPLIVITDRYSPWPRQYTPHVLSVTTATNAFLDSTAGLSALLGLFINGVTARLGKDVKTRLAEMKKLTAHFDPYTYDPSGKGGVSSRNNGKST